MQLVQQQRKMIEEGPVRPSLLRPCTLGDGIASLDDWKAWHRSGQRNSVCFFIPASGSASRLWNELHNWKAGDENAEMAVRQMVHLPQFRGIFHLEDHEQTDLEEFYRQLEEAGLIDSPKGGIPFHLVQGEGISPFAGHMFQLADLGYESARVHYTLSERFLEDVKESLIPFQRQTGVDIELSIQDPTTNSLVYDLNLLPLEDEEGEPLTRPSGHGALLPNIQQLDSELILVKNVDNILHPDRSKEQTKLADETLGLLKAMVDSRNDFFKGKVTYDELHPALKQCIAGPEDAAEALDRPMRVCGMVENKGKPGGGPFWVKEPDGRESVQIVEQSQIENTAVLENATHFNPVFMALHIYDADQHKYDLAQYADDEQFMVVTKPHGGRSVCFIERPGLWNGSMSKWLTLFVEIPGETCTQVKTILDLAGQEHQPL